MHNLSFPKDKRLLVPNDFRRVLSNKTRYESTLFALYVRMNTLSHPRIGLTVSYRYVKEAVLRNTIKRIIRESFRKNQSQLGSFDIVIMVKKQLKKVDKLEARKDIDLIWSKCIKR